MLHITNGDAAADVIRRAGVPGEVLPWREVLHEGSVPAGLPLDALFAVRAEFIASRGWATPEECREAFAAMRQALDGAPAHDEVVLWFEHDLFDQLQLLQLLDWFAEHPVSRLTLVNPAEYLGPATPERLTELFEARRLVAVQQLEEGVRCWDAFRAPSPLEIERTLRSGPSQLPFVAGAFRRLLEELPGAGDGLSRTERQMLAALRDGSRSGGELFRLHGSLEDPVWLGDSTFAGYLEALAEAPHPLITVEGTGEWHGRTAVLTADGRRVMDGELDAVELRGIDRWLGGTHLQGHAGVWRWDGVRSAVGRR